MHRTPFYSLFQAVSVAVLACGCASNSTQPTLASSRGETQAVQLANNAPDAAVADAATSLATTADAAALEPTPPVQPPPLTLAERLRKTTPDDMNVLLITVDTLRWDLHYAGNPREMSPNIDKLAEQSIVFERAYGMSSYTGRAVGPLLAGRYPTECPNNDSHYTAYHQTNEMLAERLKEAGFATSGAASHYYFGSHFGLTQGFDNWDMSAVPAGHDPTGTSTDGDIANATIALLRRAHSSGKRFFVWTHFIDPHAAYVEHRDVTRFGRQPRDMYDGEIMSTDRHIGRLLAALDASPEGKKTIVVLTADHGEMFHEHGMSRHGRELWENLVRVPLIVRVPGIAAHHVATRRSQVDLVPTLLELLRVDSSRGPALQGKSLVADMLGDTPEERPVLIDLPQGPSNGPRRAFIKDGWKLMVASSNQRQLFHLDVDGDEAHDLAESDPDQLAKMTDALRTFTSSFSGRWSWSQPARSHGSRRHHHH